MRHECVAAHVRAGACGGALVVIAGRTAVASSGEH